MEFNDHEELVKIKFHKINDLIPFSNQYDCEMTPDFIDGGHGIQVSQSRWHWVSVRKYSELFLFQDPRLFSHHNKFFILFNGRRQFDSKFKPCSGKPQRGIYLAHITIMDRTLKLTNIRIGFISLSPAWGYIDVRDDICWWPILDIENSYHMEKSHQHNDSAINI